ncbi:MAG: MptD family putative ECF transporter S component [Eggerthellaceae bacterium]|nr:MptD family putative ECF transporter S component [Eggerthellaceae bacterium]
MDELKEKGSNRWTTRDVLTFIVFNIIIIVIVMAAKMIEDMLLTPQNTFFVGSWLFPLLATPFYMVMADRIAKRGVLAGTTMIFGIMYTLMGGLYCLPVAIIGAIIGEAIMWKAGSYHDVKRLIGGYIVYWITFGMYGVVPYMFFREAYSQQLLAYYSEADVAAMVAQYTEPQWILLMCAMFVVGTIVGGLIGSKLLNRHVRKAKIA